MGPQLDLWDDWRSLERIADRLSRPDYRVSAGQVASVLIHERLEQLGREGEQ